jgi:hypothetical protein
LKKTEDLEAGYFDEEKYKTLAIGQLDILYELETFIYYCKEYINNSHVKDILELYSEKMTGTDVGKKWNTMQKIDKVIDAQIERILSPS